jgi:hypothetical protein|tara:strand:- start:1840 stop:2202 length:363 start_codon:yes stop_codon:yes gene_type:complete
MAVTTGKNSTTQKDFLLTDPDVDEVGVDDVFGGSAVIHGIFLENTHGSTAAHFKAYDNAAGVPGTTAPDIMIAIPGDKEHAWFIIDGIFFTNFSYACVQEDGTSGTTAPAAAVKLHAVVR